MNKRRHPKDITLERYRSSSLTPEEKLLVEEHLSSCADCRDRIEALQEWERQVASYKPELLPDDFTDQVMARLEASLREHPQTEEQRRDTLSGTNKEGAKRVRFIRPELANALIATAATYIFISTGMVKLVFKLNQEVMEAGISANIASLLQWMDRIVELIPS